LKGRLRNIETLFLAVAIVNVFAVIFYQSITYRVFFHSDSAIINVLAGEIARTGQFFPEEWYYGNGDIWIIFNHAIIAPLLLFFENSFALHAASGWIFTGLLLASTVYFAKRLHLSNTVLFALVATIFTGISAYVSESLFGQMSHGYAWGFLFLLLTLGALLPIKSRKEAQIDRWHLAALAILLFLLGLTGVRFLFSILLPLCAVLMIIMCTKYLRDGMLKERKLQKSKIFEASNYSFLAFLIGFFLFFYGSGLLLNKKWLIDAVSYMDISASLTITSFEQIARHLDLFIEGYFFSAGVAFHPGYEYSLPTFYNTSIVSLDGIEMIFRILLFGWLFFLPWVLLFKIGKIDSHLLFTLVVFYCFSFTLTLIFYLFSNNLAIAMPAIRYFSLLQVLSTTISIIFISTLAKNWGPRIWHLYFVVLVFHSIFSWQHLVADGLTRGESGELRFKKSQFDPLISLLREHDLEYGYASFWNASVNTVLSAGDVRIAGVNINSDGITPFRVLTSEAWYRPSFYRGPTFLILSAQEEKLISDHILTLLGQPTVIHDVDHFRVLVYDFNIMEKLYDGGPVSIMRSALPRDARHGKLEGCPEELKIPADETVRIPLQVRNLSQTTWSSRGPYPVRVGAHLLAPDGTPVQPDILRAGLAGDLRKGELVEVNVIFPPVDNGDYLLSVDLVQDGVAWFNNACQIRLSVR